LADKFVPAALRVVVDSFSLVRYVFKLLVRMVKMVPVKFAALVFFEEFNGIN